MWDILLYMGTNRTMILFHTFHMYDLTILFDEFRQCLKQIKDENFWLCSRRASACLKFYLLNRSNPDDKSIYTLASYIVNNIVNKCRQNVLILTNLTNLITNN